MAGASDSSERRLRRHRDHVGRRSDCVGGIVDVGHVERLALVPNQVVDGLRARIFRLLVSKPQSKEGPSCPMLTPA